jgi:hypothetical protein
LEARIQKMKEKVENEVGVVGTCGEENTAMNVAKL